jgi:prepilin-type N-terminal cleavage/methylation domain-containing protein
MKRAFTMLELIFVIVVMGILAGAIIPNINSNPLREAAIQLISHIRYTQHLAMVDDKFDTNDSKWFTKRWQIIFGKSNSTEHKWAYTIFSDYANSDSNPNLSEIAKDPLRNGADNSTSTAKLLSGGYSGILNSTDKRANKKMNLGMSYGITDISMSGGCSASNVRISFDVMGRPIQKPLDSYTTAYKSTGLIKSTCNIILKHNDSNITIAIEPETGYAHIL